MHSTEDFRTAALRYAVDTALCAGHGRCYSLDPDHFDSDDVGYAVVLDRAESASRRAAMEDVVAACPEGAISIVEDPAGS